ncbi:hypothetical protein C8J56DRAFT_814803 [Mycena floridula]|nr:hypothetical protein C8J56DRAFT_814803 [Mycena floridula]
MTSQLSPKAQSKLLLHSAKYPDKRVCGILVGNDLDITDTIPLLHVWTSLSPMLEIALALASQHVKSKSLAVVGYYATDEALLSLLPRHGLGILVGARTLQTYQPQNDGWVASKTGPELKGVGEFTVPNPAALAKFVDFDDHLGQVTLDWLDNRECGV